MTAKRLRIAALSLIALPSAAQAQGASAPRPPLRQLGPVQATSTDTLVGITNIRAMSTGHLLVNDVLSRRSRSRFYTGRCCVISGAPSSQS